MKKTARGKPGKVASKAPARPAGKVAAARRPATAAKAPVSGARPAGGKSAALANKPASKVAPRAGKAPAKPAAAKMPSPKPAAKPTKAAPQVAAKPASAAKPAKAGPPAKIETPKAAAKPETKVAAPKPAAAGVAAEAGRDAGATMIPNPGLLSSMAAKPSAGPPKATANPLPKIQETPPAAAPVTQAKVLPPEPAPRAAAASTMPNPVPDAPPAEPTVQRPAPRPPHMGGPMLPPRPAAPKGPPVEFKAGDHVVYPTHGVGTVQGIEEMPVAGMALKVIVVTFEENRMTLRVPVNKAASSGLRKLATTEAMAEALDTLKGRARIKRTMWSRRAQEYEAKINSGDPVAIAEVVRDLHRNAGQPDQSFSERQIYEQALDRLAAELAAIDRTDKAAAAEKLQTFLKAA
ncbi:MAG TPA: CarD family transcriptional regulator [Acetobacteraceae bacterium]|nr:CarD family transcriptional regulator [Acetobacteraceae bacterium]